MITDNGTFDLTCEIHQAFHHNKGLLMTAYVRDISSQQHLGGPSTDRRRHTEVRRRNVHRNVRLLHRRLLRLVSRGLLTGYINEGVRTLT